MQAAKRNKALIIAVIVMCIWSFLYVKGLFEQIYGASLADNVNNVSFDGADFTGFFKLGAVVLDGFIGFIAMVLYIFFITLFSVAAFAAVYFVSVRRRTEVLKDDIDFSGKTVWGCTALFLLVSLIVTRFSLIVPTLLLFWQTPLFAWLFCIRPLKNKYKSMNDVDNEK